MIKTYAPIPQNNKYFFIIEKSDWKNSIDITFDHNYETDISNLFLILKSYLINKNLIIKKIYLISKDFEDTKSNEKAEIYHTINSNRINKLTYNGFMDWFEEKYDYDWKYVENKKYYGFRIVFFEESIHWISGEIYPRYPWNIQFKAELLATDRENTLYKNKIDKLENKIKELEKKIK